MYFSELTETVIMDIDEDIYDTEVLEKVKRYINRGYRELSKKELLETTVNSTISNYRVRKPDNCIRILSVSVDDVQVKWRLEGLYIYIESEGRAKIVYNYLPDLLVNDDDETETNEGNIEYIINFAKWLYHINEGSTEDAQVFKMEYESMNIITNSNITKIIDVYGVV